MVWRGVHTQTWALCISWSLINNHIFPSAGEGVSQHLHLGYSFEIGTINLFMAFLLHKLQKCQKWEVFTLGMKLEDKTPFTGASSSRCLVHVLRVRHSTVGPLKALTEPQSPPSAHCQLCLPQRGQNQPWEGKRQEESRAEDPGWPPLSPVPLRPVSLCLVLPPPPHSPHHRLCGILKIRIR